MAKAEITAIPLSDGAGWMAALADVPHAFAHTAECCQAIGSTIKTPTNLYVWRRADSCGVCPLSERESDGSVDVFTPYQFSGFAGNRPDPQFEKDWRAFAAERGWVTGYHAMHPLLSNDSYYNASDCVVQNDLYVLDLRRSIDRLFAALDRNRRRELREYAATAFLSDRERLMAFLVAEYPSFVQRVGASMMLSSETLMGLARAESTLLVGTATRGTIDAVYLFGYTRFAGDCLLNVATPAGRSQSTRLLWHGMLELKKRGVPRLNLGGGVRRGDPVARAKERLGPVTVPFRSVKQVYRPAAFVERCRAAGADPEDRLGYFPPYLRPAL